ncbi:MAG: ZIP family metal transporter [Pseudomonadota bacterium]|nr:ZIP family metal transporter [Pseudomonadota bacterium]
MSQLTPGIEAVLASVAVACAALAARSVVWLSPAHLRRWLPWMQSGAAGLLLGDALLHMLPAALYSGLSPARLGQGIAAGALGLLAIECVVRAIDTRSATATFAKMNVIGDVFHHFVDGVVIGASFVVSPALGMIVSMAILAHELPREAGNAAVLVAGGYTPSKAFSLSLATTLAIPAGALSMTVAAHTPSFIGTSLALAAGTTLYLAMGDVIPGIWVHIGARTRLLPIIGVGAGTLFMWLATAVEHRV